MRLPVPIQAVFTVGLLATSVAAQSDAGTYAITDARIVTVTNGVIESGTVVFSNGIITAVGADVQVPAGAWVIDGAGKTVYPGFVSGFSSLGMPAPPRPARGGQGSGTGGAGQGQTRGAYSTGPASRPATFTWLSAADELTVDTAAFDAWRSAGFTTVVTAPTRGFFSGHAAVVNLGQGRPNSLVLRNNAGVRFNLQGGAGHRGYPSSRPGVFSYLKQTFLDARHYGEAWARYESDPTGIGRPEYDRALEGLVAVSAGNEPLLFPGGTAAEIDRAIATTETVQARGILYGGGYVYRSADALATAGMPVIIDLDWPAAPRDGDPEADESLDVLRHRLLAPTGPARLAEAGVPFAFQTSELGGANDALPAIRQAVSAGLSTDDAIQALTLGPAQIFGVADRIGSIEPGKIANLTVTTGDVFEDGTDVTTVFVDGEMFETNGRGSDEGRGGRGRPDGEGDDSSADTDRLRALIGASFRGPYRDDDVTVIQNATIVTVTNGTIENGSIVIQDGRIAEVGTDVRVPGGARVIDATGRFVMPGIIDAHSHVGGGFNEGSVSVSAMTQVADNLNPDDINIYRALAGGVTTINILHGSSNPVGGQNAVIKLRWGQSSAGLLMEGAPPGIKFALGENPKRGRNPPRYPNSRMGVMDVIRQAFIDAQEYMAEWDAFAGGDGNGIPPRRDLKLEALAEILRGERLVHAHSYRGDEILQLLRLAEEFGFRVATLQHVLEGYKVAKEIAEHGAGASTFSDWWSYKVEAYDAIPYNAAIMVEKGVSVSINSDSNEEMRHLNEEAAKTMHWGGLTETEALSLITINPARQLGIADRIGSIEVGKDADLAVFDRHPLDNYAVVQQTYVDGKLYFDIEADRERQAAIESEKEALKSAGARATTSQGEGR